MDQHGEPRDPILRSSFGAIEDWNNLMKLRLNLSGIAIVFRGDRGLEQSHHKLQFLGPHTLRSSFGAIEDWNPACKSCKVER